MLRTIILMRHAKSNWAIPMQPDYDRTLNARGIENAPMMAKRLLERGIHVDAIISSSAVRALETAKYLKTEMPETKTLLYKSELYQATPKIIEEEITDLDNNWQTVLMVCHNPGITYWANAQCGVITENMPTASMVAFTFESEFWYNYSTSNKKLLFYDWPKNLK
jgi:phosphohistidine phosphatase